jgi:hypothetical protein
MQTYFIRPPCMHVCVQKINNEICQLLLVFLPFPAFKQTVLNSPLWHKMNPDFHTTLSLESETGRHHTRTTLI